MATDRETVTHICDQMAGAGTISSRAMFGEYAVYCEGRVVALVCDNQLFLRPTPSALTQLPNADMGPPYPGAKPHIMGDALLDDPETLAQIIRLITAEVPLPKPKKPKKAK